MTEPPFEKDSSEAQAVRIVFVSHVQAHFARQHRVFIHQLAIFGDHARFIRWDRASAIVSDRFDYVKNPYILAEYLHALSQADDESCGWDCSASQASESEAARFECAVQKFLAHAPRRLPDSAKCTLDHTYPTWKVVVRSQSTTETAHLIVRRPFAGDEFMLDRGTRAYIAYDTRADRLVFLKDSWRLTNGFLEHSETEIYNMLKEKGVPHIPVVLYGGDVPTNNSNWQRTMSTGDFADYEDKESLRWWMEIAPLQALTHHRIVQEILYPLYSVRNGTEFTSACFHVLIGKQLTTLIQSKPAHDNNSTHRGL